MILADTVGTSAAAKLLDQISASTKAEDADLQETNVKQPAPVRDKSTVNYPNSLVIITLDKFKPPTLRFDNPFHISPDIG